MNWIKTSDKLPKSTERVIGYDEFYGRVGEAMIASWSERLIFIDSDDCNIILWMPMPHPPRELVEKG